MDLNVAVATNELFENNDMVFPILLGRENLKVSLASPGSESSGVSSLDAEEAKKMANDQLTTSSSSSSETASESNSSDQTEGESSDESNENEQSSDDETSTKQQTIAANGKLNVTIDEQKQRSPDLANEANVDETKTIETNGIANNDYGTVFGNQNEQVSSFKVEEINNITPATHDITTFSEDDLDDIRYKKLKLIYDGRDILDLANNLNKSINIQYTKLPDFNIPMYMANRSQYHRLGSSWETHELKYATCRRCAFSYVPDAQAAKSCAISDSYSLLINLNHISAITAPVGNNNMPMSSPLNRISPANSTLNPATPKFQPSSSTTPLPTAAGQMFNFNNMNNNNNQQQQPPLGMYASTRQLNLNNQHVHPTLESGNNMSLYKQQQQHQQQQQQQQQQNAYGNINMTLNSMISQLAMDTNNSAFNPNQYLNGGGNGTNYTPNNINQMANNLNTSAAIINQLMNQNRQNQSGMCRPLANKSGINLNANSHNKMPAYKMYSHF